MIRPPSRFSTRPQRRPIKPVNTTVEIPAKPKKSIESASKAAVYAQPTSGFDKAAAEELGALLDEKIARDSSKLKRQRWTTLIVLVAIIGGSTGWFIQSPERVHALKSAIKEVRSVTDIKAIVASYQKSLDKIAARSQQIDQASSALGVEKSASDEKDPYMEAEMSAMMGGEGKTVGSRNKALQSAFGDRAEEAGGVIQPKAKTTEENSFDIGN